MKEKTKNNILAIVSIILYLTSIALIETIIIIETIKTRRILGISVDIIHLLSNIFMGLYRSNQKTNNNNIDHNQSLDNIVNQLSNNKFGSLTNLNTNNIDSNTSSPLNTPINEILLDPFLNIPKVDDNYKDPKTPRNSRIFITSDLTPEQEEYLKSHT